MKFGDDTSSVCQKVSVKYMSIRTQKLPLNIKLLLSLKDILKSFKKSVQCKINWKLSFVSFIWNWSIGPCICCTVFPVFNALWFLFFQVFVQISQKFKTSKMVLSKMIRSYFKLFKASRFLKVLPTHKNMLKLKNTNTRKRCEICPKRRLYMIQLYWENS